MTHNVFSMSALKSYLNEHEDKRTVTNDSVTSQTEKYEKACAKLRVPVVKGLLQNLTNTNLNLQHRGIGEKGFRAIALVLKKNTCITDLNLSDNNLVETCGETITKLFEANKHLKRLDLSCNNIGDYGVALLFVALETTAKIEYLNISRNRCRGCLAIVLARSNGHRI